ncbi:MAG: hypothetical protein ACUVX1_11505 [Chloroflexota bacterium]
MYISRIADAMLLALLAMPKVLIVAGAWQVGKTTLLEHVTEGRGAVVLNLDLEVAKARLLAASQLTPLQARQSLGSPSILIKETLISAFANQLQSLLLNSGADVTLVTKDNFAEVLL